MVEELQEYQFGSPAPWDPEQPQRKIQAGYREQQFPNIS